MAKEIKAPKIKKSKVNEEDFILDIDAIREHDPRIKRIIIKVR